MIKYKYLYNDYLKEMDQKRNELASQLEIKVNNNIREIGFLNDDINKTNKAYVIVTAIFAILLGPFYYFMDAYLELYSILIYLGVAALGLFIVFLVELYLKHQLKMLEDETKNKDNELEKQLYKEKEEKLYSIALFIICVNENYSYLNSLSPNERDEKWQKIVENRKNIINMSMNYKPNVEKYERYLQEWMSRYEKCEKEDN